MKRVLYIHQYFKTPEEGGAIRSYHIVTGLVDHGIEVEMITSHNSPKYKLKSIKGIKVHYLPVNYSNEYSAAKRIKAFSKFVWQSIRLAQSLPRPDLIYATSTPLTIGVIALWHKWIRQIPYIFEVRDLWPEAPIQLKMLKSTLLIAFSRKLEKTIYKNASSIIALSPGIKSGILNCYKKTPIHIIPNMSEVDFFNEKKKEFKKKKGIVIGYFGAFGFANNLRFILDIAHECQKKKLDVLFKMAGEGSKKRNFESMVKKMNLDNIEVYTFRNRNEVKRLMSEVDACLTSFLNIPILETNSPNKFFDGLASGRLCIVNTKGWLKELVEKYKCGFYIDPTKPENFPGMIKQYISKSELLLSQQQNALKLAKGKFEKNDLVKKISNLVLEHIPNN